MDNLLPQYIYNERTKRGWSQKELGDKAGCAQSTIQQAETGGTESLKVKTMVSIAKAFNEDPVRFLNLFMGLDPDQHLKHDKDADLIKNQLYDAFKGFVAGGMSSPDTRDVMQKMFTDKED